MKTTNLVKQKHIEEVSDQQRKKSDLLMNYFLISFFLIGLLLAFYYDTWLIGIGAGGLSLVAYYTTKFIRAGSNLYQYVLSAVIGVFMAQYIYQTRGMFEMQFIAFIGSAILIIYQNWKLQIPLAIVVLLHHAVFGYLQFKGFDKIYFTQSEHMNLQTGIIYGMLATIIFSLCGLWAYKFKRSTNNNISQSFEIGRLQEADKQKEALMSMSENLRISNEQLKKAHRDLETLFENIEEVFFSVEVSLTENGPQFKPLHMSSACEKVFGYAVDEFIKNPKLWRDLILEEDKVIMDRHFPLLLQGKPIEHENRIHHKNGEIRWVQTRITPTLNDAGSLIRMDGVASDIDERKLAEENLEKTLREISDYKYSLDESSIVAITDQKGIIKHVNDNFCRISKYSEEELIGQDHRIINSGYHPKEFIRNLWIAISNGKIWRGELKNKAKDGTYYWVDTTIVPFLNEAGKPYQYMAVRADITMRKEAEQEVIKAYKEKETVLNRISDAVVSVDNDWRYTFLNDAALATHPQGKQETLGKVIWEVHPEMNGTVFWDKYHEAMRTGKVIEIEDYFAPMDIWFSVKVYPSSDGLTIFYKNVTERKKAEQKLSQTLREVTDYKYALDESSIVAITDQKGIIKYANDNFCKISKYSIMELIGQDHRIINSGYHPKEFIRNLWITISNGKIWRGELKNEAKDNTYYWVDTTIVPFLNEGGKPYQYMAVGADITERKLVERKLEEANLELNKRAAELALSNEELERFAYVASHDLQEPLRMVDSFLQLLQNKYEHQLDETAQKYINFAVDGAGRMKTLIFDLLEFSRITTVKKEHTIINLNELINKTLGVLHTRLDESKASVTVGRFPEVYGNESQLMQLFQNLTSNALKYRSKVNPMIELGFTEKNDVWEFFVKDNGIGIDAVHFDKIFVIFQRLHNRNEYSGTGIGLAICKKIVELHEGKIWVESSKEKGSTFYFTISKFKQPIIKPRIINLPQTN